MAAARQDEAELRPLLPEVRERLEEPRMVLVWPRTGRIEQELLPRLVSGPEALVVDTPGDRVHVLRWEPEQLDRPAADELARHDHGVGLPGRALVRARPEEPLGAREELWVVEVLEVVDRHHGRDVERGQGDRQRVVDGVEGAEATPQPAGPHRRECHRERAFRDDRFGPG